MKLPNGHCLVECTMKDVAWPSDLILDLTKSNWTKWNYMLKLAVCQCGICPWLEGSIPCPNLATSPDAYHIWMHNDDSLSAFITCYISKSDVLQMELCTTASAIYAHFHSLHEQQGAYAQLSLFTKVLQVCLIYDTPLDETVAEIATFHKWIIAMGSMKDDDLLVAFLLHSMSDNFPHLQDAIQNMMHLTNFSSEMVIQCIYSESALIHH